MSEGYFGWTSSNKNMTHSQLKKIKKSMQKSYDKVEKIAQIEKHHEWNKEEEADIILQQQLNNLDL